jgi:protein-S-isoprenylcysteine O-methyltransferase Ste14
MILFIIIWAVWFTSEILLNRFFRSGHKDKKGVDKNSLRIIWITIGVANMIAVLFAQISLLSIGKTLIIPHIGLFMIISGMIIRFAAIYTLGKFFTVDLTIKEDHKIKKDGLFTLIRHPSYTGSLLSFFGFGLSLNDWISLVVIFIPVLMAFIYRIRLEEKMLTDKFGTDYSDYMKNTYRLIPWIY